MRQKHRRILLINDREISENAQRDRTTMADAGITDDIIVQIIKAGIEAAKDNDKVGEAGKMQISLARVSHW